MSDKPEFTRVTLSTPAAQVLLNWLSVVPDEVIPVTHASDRQALADLLFALENGVVQPGAVELERARELLTRDSGDWIYKGPIYRPDTKQ